MATRLQNHNNYVYVYNGDCGHESKTITDHVVGHGTTPKCLLIIIVGDMISKPIQLPKSLVTRLPTHVVKMACGDQQLKCLMT